VPIDGDEARGAAAALVQAVADVETAGARWAALTQLIVGEDTAAGEAAALAQALAEPAGSAVAGPSSYSSGGGCAALALAAALLDGGHPADAVCEGEHGGTAAQHREPGGTAQQQPGSLRSAMWLLRSPSLRHLACRFLLQPSQLAALPAGSADSGRGARSRLAVTHPSELVVQLSSAAVRGFMPLRVGAAPSATAARGASGGAGGGEQLAASAVPGEALPEHRLFAHVRGADVRLATLIHELD
jgi:hypothetical protein